MDPLAAITGARWVGETVSGIREGLFESVETVAKSFGLYGELGPYIEISASAASSVLTDVIHRDMAYSSEIVPLHKAKKLADAFVAEFQGSAARFFSNGFYRHGLGKSRLNTGWQSATDATFDTGILVVCCSRSACVWFKDED